MIAYLPLILMGLGTLVNAFHGPISRWSPTVAGVLSDLFPIVQRTALRLAGKPPRSRAELIAALVTIDAKEQAK